MIVIIGMLMALLLPAVNAVREAGRRTTCTNNQFQQAFAMVRFNDSKRYIPGWRNPLVWATVTASSTTTGTSAVSWPIVILPNMERNDVYKTWATAATGSTVYISFFVCPSTPPDALAQPTLAYVASAGIGSNSTAGRATGVCLDITGTDTLTQKLYARVSMDDVAGSDGLATTLIISEETGPQVPSPTPLTWNFQPAASNGVINWSSNTPAFGIVSTSGPPLKMINSGTYVTGSSSAANMPSSNHPGGAVVAFCDGHTGFLKDSVRGNVYAQLMSWNHTVASGTASYSNWVPATDVLKEGDYQ